MLGFAAPWALILLPLPWLVWRFAPPYRSRSAGFRIPFFRQITQAAGVTPQAGAAVLDRSPLQMGLAVAIWLLLICALARPERLGDPITIESAARDVVLALDISGSMDARDFTDADGKPQQRLAAVKDVLRDFIAERDGDRMALIVFGTQAFVQAPFTEDLASLDGFLDQTQVGMAGPNTAIGDAIGLAIRSFDASEVDDRLMILLSDGADTSSRMTPVNAAAIAADRGVTIHTIGVGDPNGSGEDRVDLDALKDIANRTGGGFFFADDRDGLEQVYAQIDAQTPRTTDSTTFRPSHSLAAWPMGLALLLMLGGIVAMQFRGRRV